MPADLARAAELLAGPVPARRSGIGHDAHPFGPGEPLRLGGIEIAGAPASTVTRTATSSSMPSPTPSSAPPAWAIWAACSRPTTRHPPVSTAASCSRRSCRVSQTAGWLPVGVDLTIVAHRPRLAAHLDAMRDASLLLGLDRRGRQRQGVDRQPRWLRRRRALDHNARAGHDRGAGMSVRLQDTLAGETRPLVPLRDDVVRIYSCGPTVYGPAHIGNFRSFLFADLLVRHLRWRGHTVRWVMNITDVDDKIIRGAAAAGVGIAELAERYLERFLADADALRMTRPDVLPRATEHIDEMVALIETLLEQTMPIGPTTARSSSGSPRGPLTAGWPGSIRTSSASGSASRPTSTPRTTSATSPCGRAPSRASRRGRPRSGRAGRAGTSSAPR